MHLVHPEKQKILRAGLIYPQMSGLGQAWLSGKMRVGSRLILLLHFFTCYNKT